MQTLRLHKMGFYHCSSRSDFGISERDERGIEQ